MMIKRLLFIPLLLVLSLCLNSGAIAQELFCEPLDDFTNSSNNPVILTPENIGPVNFVDEDAGILGNFREVNFGPLTFDFPIVTSVLSIGFGETAVSNSILASAPLELVYDANGAGLNLDLSTRDLLTFVLAANDVVGTSFDMVLRDADGNEANFFIPNLPNIIDGDTLPTNIDLTIANFSGIGDVDLADIQSIKVFLNPTPDGSADTTFNAIEICGPPIREVPTLSQWGLMATAAVIGIFGFMVARRRKLAL